MNETKKKAAARAEETMKQLHKLLGELDRDLKVLAADDEVKGAKKSPRRRSNAAQAELFPASDAIAIRRGAKFQRIGKDGRAVVSRHLNDPKADRRTAFANLEEANVKNGLITLIELNHVLGFTGHTAEFVTRYLSLGRIQAVREGDRILGVTPREARRFMQWLYADRLLKPSAK